MPKILIDLYTVVEFLLLLEPLLSERRLLRRFHLLNSERVRLLNLLSELSVK